ncbi:MAG: FtsW/RodA/SpoVE family cell cycle protein [Propionibacteriaceae bacterium]|nr:FtsW/RodA/SpoVE family cell cycle protein [Propionibacteriaceae bacterium]
MEGYRTRGVAQLLLILFGQAIGFAGFILTGLNRDNAVPALWPVVAVCWFGMGLLIHVGLRLAVPYADPIIMAIVLALTGIGLAMLHRLDLTSGDPPMLYTQFLAIVIGVAALLVIVFTLRDPRRLQGFPFLLSLVGFGLLLLPLVPGLGRSMYGSRIWISLGGFSFQPAEIAKLVLAASFAAYLADKKEVLSLAGRRFLGLELPRMRDLGPVIIIWGLCLAIMVFENDLGTSLLFFGLFVMMIYVATGKASWVILGLLLFAAGGAAVIRYAGHVQRRINFWLDPFAYPDDATQIIQAQFGLSNGGLFGSGWGLGRPGLIILPASDMIAASVGEEIGIVGLMAVIILYGLFVFRGLKTALVATDPFVKLFAAGLSFAFLLQTFAIIGGVTRLLPLTGLTTPFLSQGGSSVIANWILVAVLLVVSHQARRPGPETGVILPSGATELAGERTQVISRSELKRIGTGATRPVQALEAAQVRLSESGRETEAETWSGNDEETARVADSVMQSDDSAVLVFEPADTQAYNPFSHSEIVSVPTSNRNDGDAIVTLRSLGYGDGSGVQHPPDVLLAPRDEGGPQSRPHIPGLFSPPDPGPTDQGADTVDPDEDDFFGRGMD